MIWIGPMDSEILCQVLLQERRAAVATLRKISPGLKFISVAGSEKPPENAQCRLNADAFVVKPFTDEALITAVHNVLRQPVQR